MRSERLLKKRRRRIILQTTFSVLGGIFLIALPGFVSHISAIQIQTVTIVNDGIVPEDAIKKTITEKIDGLYFHIFSRSNIFLYPKQEIKKNILSQFTRIKDISLQMKGFSQIEVHIIERLPYALWCSEMDECYFIDDTGFIFDRAPEFTKNVYISYSGTVTGEPIGSKYLESEELDIVKEVITYLSTSSLSPSTVSSLGNHEYSLGLSQGEHIFFTTRDPIKQTISNLESVLSDPKLSIRSQNGLSISSLDLRYGNKVFFKRKNGEEGSATQ